MLLRPADAVVVVVCCVYGPVVAVALASRLPGCRGCPQSVRQRELLGAEFDGALRCGSLPRATPGLDVSGDVLPGGIPVLYLVCLWLWQVPERLALALHSARPTA